MDYRDCISNSVHIDIKIAVRLFYFKENQVLGRVYMKQQTTNKKIVILGAGESGVGTAVLAKQQGFEVFVSDRGMVEDHYKLILNDLKILWEEGQHTLERILKADVVMKSPGIPDNVPMIRQLRAAGIPVISEIEFAVRYTDARIVGITGSNGKTTTTMLLGHILKTANETVGVAGNIGDSFAKMVAGDDVPLYVLELSSFQLDGIVDFAPNIAILTNITPDHLERYDNDFEKYVASKFRIAMNQKPSDYFIYDADDKVINAYLKKHIVKSQLVPFSLTKKLEKGAYIEDDNIIIATGDNTFIMPKTKLALEGNHNTKNSMAASMAARLLGIRKETIRDSMENFHGVEHRLENVLRINNVQYINDSKATNVNSVFYALDSMKTPTIWIAGGVDKGNDYSELNELVNEKVKTIICLGEDNRKIVAAFNNCVEEIYETQSMKEAVQLAYDLAEKNDTVLLSPACASFDLFKNYEERGRQFKEAVREL